MNPETTEDSKQKVSQLIDIHWNTNWSDLPPAAQTQVELAYQHLTRARDVIDDQEGSA